MEEFQYQYRKYERLPNGQYFCIDQDSQPLSVTEDYKQKMTKPAEAQEDPVNSPKHYVRGGIEVIEVLEKKMAPEAFKGFLMGNVLKYVLRHEYKNGTEDLKKARFYLERMIALDGSRSTTDTK